MHFLRRIHSYLLSGVVFLIGVALLSFSGGWWPGLLFVFGATALTQALAEGRRWYEAQWATVIFANGILFWSGPPSPVVMVLIIIGAILFWMWTSWNFFEDEYDYEPSKNRDETHDHLHADHEG